MLFTSGVYTGVVKQHKKEVSGMNRFYIRRMGVAAAAAVILVCQSMTAAAQDASGQAKEKAVEYLKSRIEAQCPVASFEVDDPLLSVSSYTYDSSIAAMALISAEEYDAASSILDAFVEGVNHDPEFNDRLRNAYMAGKASDLPGYWDEEQEMWIQDAWQVGSSTKSSCAAAVAMLMYDQARSSDAFLDTAITAVDWVIDNCRDGGAGFTSGYTGWLNAGNSTELTYKTTVDNLWMYAACTMLAEATGWDKYTEAADSAYQFVTEEMYSAGDTRFFQGTKTDGTTPVTNLISVEPQALAALCLNDDSGLDNIDSCLAPDGGYAYDNSAAEASWLEGTFMTAQAFRKIGDAETADRILTAMVPLQLPTGAFPQAGSAELSTGEADVVLHDWPSVCSCAWFILAS